MEYQVGERVVVPNCGVGRIEGIEKMDVGGSQVDLYRIDLGAAGRIWVPLGRMVAEGIRPVMGREALEETWEIVASQEVPDHREHWNRRRRRYTEMLMSNEPQAVARVVGELGAVDAEKRLPFAERQLYERARNLLVDEIAAASGRKRATVEKQLTKTLRAA